MKEITAIMTEESAKAWADRCDIKLLLERFEHLVNPGEGERLALMWCHEKATGKGVVVLCMERSQGADRDATYLRPIARMYVSDEEAFEALVPPESCDCDLYGEAKALTLQDWAAGRVPGPSEVA